MKIGCIIQGRYSSTRLPGKILLPLPYGSDTTVLEQVVNRVKKTSSIDEVIVATSDLTADDLIVKECERINVSYYRGSEQNVLKRYYDAAVHFDLDIIIRITSDCPCLDYDVLEKLIQFHLDSKNDYSSNSLKRTFPHGLDCEIFNFRVLKQAYDNAQEDFEFEHVTTYIYKSHQDKFKIGCLENVYGDFSDIRITLDTYEDYMAIAAVYDYLKKDFLLNDIIALYDEKPWLYNINDNINQKKIFDNLNEEIDEAITILDKQELKQSAKILKDYLGNKNV